MAKKEKDKDPVLENQLDQLGATAQATPVELSPQEEIRLLKEAEEEIQAELHAEKREAFKEAAKKRLKKQVLFKHGKDEAGDSTELVMVYLAPHAPYIRLDNAVYLHGRAYRLTQARAQAVKDVMYRTWLHDHELSGQDMNAFYGKQKRHEVLSPGVTA